MSKLGAILIGTLALFVLSFSLLPSAFSPLINWLGPIFGVSFQTMLAILFFTAGNPLVYPIVFATWLAAGVIVGLLARGIKSAIVAAPIIYGATLGLLGLAIANIVMTVSSTGLSKGVLPPPPPGTNTATILNVPVFRQFAPLLISSLSSASAPSIGSLASVVIPPIIGNFVIFIASAVAIGFGVPKLFTKFAIASRLHLGGPSSAPKLPKVIGALALVMLVFSSAFAGFASAQAPFSYAEAVVSVINPNGSVTNYYAFASSSLTLSSGGNSISSSSLSGTGIVAAIVASQNGSLAFLPQSMTSGISQYMGLLPPTLAVLLYQGTCTSSQSEASSTSTTLASIFNLNDLSLLVSQSVSGSSIGMQSTQEICFYVYQSNVPLSSMADSFVSTVLPSVHQSGLINIFSQGLSSKYLVPGATSTSVNSSAILTGFFDPQFLSSFPLLGQAIQNFTSSMGIVGFAGGLATTSNVIHSSSTTHTASFSYLLNYGGSVSFASDSTLSAAGIGVPLPGASSNSFSPSDYNFTLATNNPQAMSYLSSSQMNSNVIQVNSGQSVPTQQLGASFTGIFPAYLQVTKSLSQQASGNVLVNIVVKNLDTDNLANLYMNDTQFANFYQGALSIVSGSPSNSSVSSLAPGASVTYSYLVKLSGIGTYVSPPAQIAYNLNGTQFSAISNSATVSQPNAGAAQALGALVSTAGKSLDIFLNTGGYGAGIVIAALLGLFALAGFMEYRQFVKWRKL